MDYRIIVGSDAEEDGYAGIVTCKGGYVSLGNFVSPEENYGFAKDDEGNVRYGQYVTVHFNKGDDGAFGILEDVRVIRDTMYILPSCAFMPPQNKGFQGWRIGANDSGKPRRPGTGIVITGETTLYKVWAEGIPYVDEYDVTHICSDYTLLSAVEDADGVTLRGGWYVAQGETFNYRLNIEGEVNIIITTAGSDTDLLGGLQLVPPNALHVWNQAGWRNEGTGKLLAVTGCAQFKIHMAGIGGDTQCSSGDFHMHNGVLEDQGHMNGPGSGGTLVVGDSLDITLWAVS